MESKRILKPKGLRSFSIDYGHNTVRYLHTVCDPGWAQPRCPAISTKVRPNDGRKTRPSLQGADTIIWLAISKSVQAEQSGTLWFDRRIVAENFFLGPPARKNKNNCSGTLEEMMEHGLSELMNLPDLYLLVTEVDNISFFKPIQSLSDRC